MMSRGAKRKVNNFVFGGWRSMWVLVCFDLPTITKAQKRNYIRFKKMIENNGFNMMQFSLYTKQVSSIENARKYEREIKKNIPTNGHVRIFMITDKQFGAHSVYFGKHRIQAKESSQLTFFI